MRPRILFVAGALVLLLLFAASGVFAATPMPDPRSGPMPSQVGQPSLAALAVIILGVTTAALTALYVKVRGRLSR